MLGLLLLYWIGKYFYKLAEEYNKSQWGFAVLGVITYYAGTFFSGVFIGIATEIISPGYWDDFNEMLFGVMMIPFGLLSAYILYKILESSWKRSAAEKLFDPFEVKENSETIQ